MGEKSKFPCPSCEDGDVEKDDDDDEWVCQDCFVCFDSEEALESLQPETEPEPYDDYSWAADEYQKSATDLEPQVDDSKETPIQASQDEDPDWVDSDVFVQKLRPRDRIRIRRCVQEGCSGELFDARLSEDPEDSEDSEDSEDNTENIPNFICQECGADYDIDKSRKLMLNSASRASRKPTMLSVILIQKARAYLNSYSGSKGRERTKDFSPFFEAALDLKPASRKERMEGLTVQDEEDPDEKKRVAEAKEELQEEHLARLFAKAGDPGVLPGPPCLLETDTRLPPRGFWLRENMRADGTYKSPRDYIPPKDRLDFELYIWIHQQLNKPWPLALWGRHIKSGKAIRTVLEKGGALSKRASEELTRFNQRDISEDDVLNFVESLRYFSDLSLDDSTRDKVVSEAFGILKEMHNLQPPEFRTNVLDLFIENNCLASHKHKPVEFWRLDRNKKRQPVCHLKLISIPIAYAVSYSVARLGHSVGYLLEYAHIDVENGLTNCAKISALNYYWAWSLDKIGRDGNLLRK